MDDTTLSAQEAASALGVSVATIYAYVSRGLIRAERGAAQTSRYRREDVERLRARKEARGNPAAVAAQALHWGTPVLDSALTLIEGGRLFYRGLPVEELARSWTVEAVAQWFWLGEPEDAGLFDQELRFTLPELPPSLHPVEACAAALPLFAAEDLAAFDLRLAALPRAGARILALLAATMTRVEEPGPLAACLARTWAPENPAAERLIAAALIVSADHELNVSSFTARCVASAGAPLYQVVSAGLAALQGVHHGKHAERATLMLEELALAEDIPHALAQRLRRGEQIHGFGHPIYPGGDPRGRLLLDLAQVAFANTPTAALARAVEESGRAILGEHPTIDLGLAVIASGLALPPGGAMALFALGRTIGWIGHSLEQYALGQLIRPRARYTGPRPQDAP